MVKRLKATEFPDLAAVLEYAFGEYDISRGGGGVEAHPCLTTGTLYRAADSATSIKRSQANRTISCSS